LGLHQVTEASLLFPFAFVGLHLVQPERICPLTDHRKNI